MKESNSLALDYFMFIENTDIAIMHFQVKHASCASIKNNSIVILRLKTRKWFDCFPNSWRSVGVESFGGEGFLFAVVRKVFVCVAAKSKLELSLVQQKEEKLLFKLMFASEYILESWEPFKLLGLETLAFKKLYT